MKIKASSLHTMGEHTPPRVVEMKNHMKVSTLHAPDEPQPTKVNAGVRLTATRIMAAQRIRVMAADPDKAKHESARSYLSEVAGIDVKGREVLGADDQSCFIIKTKDFDKAMINVQKHAGGKKPKMSKSTKDQDEPDRYEWKTSKGTVRLQKSMNNGRALTFISLLA